MIIDIKQDQKNLGTSCVEDKIIALEEKKKFFYHLL